jgi:ATP-binding cassette subfamily B multidrug efflux pump
MRKSGMTLDSLILEGGSNLSIGERQLVALTRVLLRNPAILVLDEATANIDPYFEKIIHTAVDKIMEERTCLMIAHRLDTLDHCDRIFVFENGELLQHGSRDELMKMDGHFRNLHEAAKKNPHLLN